MEHLTESISQNPGLIVVVIGVMGIIGAIIGMYLSKRKGKNK